jgi:hypothetical protein
MIFDGVWASSMQFQRIGCNSLTATFGDCDVIARVLSEILGVAARLGGAAFGKHRSGESRKRDERRESCRKILVHGVLFRI